MEHAYGVLYCCFRSYTLYRLDDEFLCLLVSVQLCLVHYLVDVACCICASFVLKTFYQSSLCFVGAKSTEFLKLFALLELHLLEFVLLHLEQFLLVVDALLLLINVLSSASQFFLTLIKTYLALFKSVLSLLDFLVPLLDLLFKFRLLVKEFLFHFKEFFLLDNISLFRCCVYHLLVFSRQYITEYKISAQSTHYERCGNN